jgi:crossover junction endodeoxyribonuclease RuvC
MSTPVRILGIDPGFDRLGIAIIDKEGTKETLVYSCCVTTSKKESFESRLACIGKELSTIIKKYKPQELAMETLFFTSNQKTIITVAEVRGVCLYLASLASLTIFEYSPPQVKMAVTGYGKSTKEDIAIMLPKILRTPLPPHILDDEMDAIAIALTHSANRTSQILALMHKK